MSRLNIVIGADISALKKGFDDAVKIVAESSKGMDSQIGAAAKNIQDRLEALASKRPTQRVVRELQTLAMEARNLGPEFKSMADKFIQAAGEMQDNIADTRGEIAYFASDTRRLDAAIQGVQVGAAAFGLVQGSMAAMGDQSEELQKQMARLQGVMVVLNSLQTIQNALQAESALSIGLSTAAAKIQSYVMGQATVAARAYAATLATLGIGAVILLLGALASSLFDVQTETKSVSKEMDDLFEKQKKNAQDAASLQKTFNDVELNRKLNAAKRSGASEKQLRDLEIGFLNDKIKKQSQVRDSYKAGSLERIAIGTLVSEMEMRKEDLITANIVEQNKKREEEEKKRAEKQKKLIEDQTPIVTGMFDNYQGVFDIKPKTLKVTPDKFELGIPPNPINIPAVITPEVNLEKLIKSLNFEAAMQTTMEQINKQFEQMIESIVVTFADSLGRMIAGDQGVFQDFGKQALLTIAAFMRQVGEALITTAVASSAFKKLLLTNPVAAGAAGVALVAGSAVIKTKLEKGPQFTAFADGGVVYGPTLGLMGEYPNARNNPEVIAPLDKLRNLITPVNNDGYIASTHISGRDLALVIEKNKTAYARG